MQPDDEICLCFHVTQRKLANYVRIEKPRRASQLSQCGGAGTGCGWCRPFLEKMFRQAREATDTELPCAEDYARARAGYIQDGKGSPPS